MLLVDNGKQRVIDFLSRYLGESIWRNGTIVIAGQPGTGKTVLSSTICYERALKDIPCLFMELYEDKEKLYRNLKSLGLDFEYLESKGLVKFVKLPIFSQEGLFEEFLRSISREIAKFKPGTLVVDSITPALEVIAESARSKAYLQNFFYELSKTINGVVVLTAEIPLGEHRIKTEGIEFIADAVIILKNEIEKDKVVRSMEVKKIRGEELRDSVIYFSIQKNKGIIFLEAPLSVEHREDIGVKLREIVEKTGLDIDVKPGEYIYIEVIPEHQSPEFTLLIPLIAAASGLKVLFISYLNIEEAIVKQLKEVIEKIIGVKSESLIESLIEKILSNMKFEYIDPFKYSLREQSYLEYSLINEYKPHIVVFHGVEISMCATEKPDRYRELLYQMILELKQRKIILVRISSRLDPHLSRFNALLADIVARAECINECREMKYYIGRKTGKQMTESSKELENYLKKLLEVMPLTTSSIKLN